VRLIQAAFAIVAILCLAACKISSDTPLVSASEIRTPLPAAFNLYTYVPAGDGSFKRSYSAPFTLQGNAYVWKTSTSTISVSVAPSGKEGEYILLLGSSGTGQNYGFARYHQGVLALGVTVGAATLKTAQGLIESPSTSALFAGAQTLPYDDISLTSRAQLDYLLRLFGQGQLPFDPSDGPAFVAGPGVKAPSKITPNGNDWILTP